MSILFTTILMAFILCSIALLILFIYYFIYRKNLDQALVNGKHHAMPPLYKISGLLAVGILATLLIFTLAKAINSQNGPIDQSYLNGVYTFDVINKDDQGHYLEMYKMDENIGYEKNIYEKDDLRYTVFIREDGYDNYHPTFLIFVEYIGDKMISAYGFDGNYLTSDQKIIGGYGANGSEFSDYFLVIGNTDMTCDFQLKVGFYENLIKDNLENADLVDEIILELNVEAEE